MYVMFVVILMSKPTVAANHFSGLRVRNIETKFTLTTSLAFLVSSDLQQNSGPNSLSREAWILHTCTSDDNSKPMEKWTMMDQSTVMQQVLQSVQFL